MSNIRHQTVTLFINSIAEIMVNDLDRITVDNVWIRDTKTNISIKINGSWRIYIPDATCIPTGEGIFLFDSHKNILQDALNERVNIELTQIHNKLYKNDNSFLSYSAIQKMRKEKPMMQEAWENLLTVYALNMDPDEKS